MFCHVMTKKCEQDTKIVINIIIILAPYLCFKAISGIVPNSTTVEGFAIAVILLLKRALSFVPTICVKIQVIDYKIQDTRQDTRQDLDNQDRYKTRYKSRHKQVIDGCDILLMNWNS